MVTNTTPVPALIDDPTLEVPDPTAIVPGAYRYRVIVTDTGAEQVVKLPITVHDLLYPEEGDEVPQNTLHSSLTLQAADVCRWRLADRPDRFVVHDVLIRWGEPGVQPLAPDIAILVGRKPRGKIGTLRPGRHYERIELVIEIASPENRRHDVAEKADRYRRAGVPFYVFVDVFGPDDNPTLRLYGFRLTPAGYVPVPLDERGRLWLEAIQAWLGLDGTRLVWWDEHDREIGDYVETARALESAETRARSAETRADTLAERLRQVEAELRRLRGDSGLLAPGPPPPTRPLGPAHAPRPELGRLL